MIQTYHAIDLLRRQWPDLEISIEQIHTNGDRQTNVPLTQIGGDGVFVTEIEHALRERRIDLAVHSLKDLPTAQPAGLRLVVVGAREDVRDVFVANEPFHIAGGKLLPVAAHPWQEVPLRIGTCSLRRMAQIRALCPDAQILPLRGNVDTRLRKLEAGDYDGIILAAAGLHRLEMQHRLAERLLYLPVEAMLPAPGQGALALEIRDEPEMRALLAPLQEVTLQAATAAERMFMRRLGAGCYLPVGAYGDVREGTMMLRGLVISVDGQRRISVQQSIPWTPAGGIELAERLGERLAEQALAQGAAEIIATMLNIREQERGRV
jgi:hydroxymethylbilane synthase